MKATARKSVLRLWDNSLATIAPASPAPIIRALRPTIDPKSLFLSIYILHEKRVPPMSIIVKAQDSMKTLLGRGVVKNLVY